MENTNDHGGGFVQRLLGKAKQMAGTVADDDVLRREGQLQEAKADAVEEAQRADSAADIERARADLAAREKELEVERDRLAAQDAAETREARLERERRAEEARIEREHAQRKAGVERQEAVAEAAIDLDEAQAAHERAADVHEADRLERQAEQARLAADALDRAADDDAAPTRTS
jgi:uncharacterized protein YjbJ (UPF0337 family)